MNLVIDSGNTRIKAALFNNTALVLKESFGNVADLNVFLKSVEFTHVLVSSVSTNPQEILTIINNSGKKLILNYQLPLPIKINYATPHTLGMDRIASACVRLKFFPINIVW